MLEVLQVARSVLVVAVLKAQSLLNVYIFTGYHP